jgi:hypothetical protein
MTRAHSIEFGLLWLASAVGSGAIARRKGRSIPGWVFLAALLGPLSVLVGLLVRPARKARKKMRFFLAMGPVGRGKRP